jgi:hypothetical protein
MNGNSIIRSPVLELTPRTVRSFGFSASLAATEGSTAIRPPILINKGIEPMVFEAARTARIIRRYLQKAFFPEYDDSRWFML